MSHYFLAIAIGIALVCLLAAAARAGRAQGITRWRCACGHMEPSPELRDHHERFCDTCQRIIRQLKETP